MAHSLCKRDQLINAAPDNAPPEQMIESCTAVIGGVACTASVGDVVFGQPTPQHPDSGLACARQNQHLGPHPETES